MMEVYDGGGRRTKAARSYSTMMMMDIAIVSQEKVIKKKEAKTKRPASILTENITHCSLFLSMQYKRQWCFG